MTKDEALAFDLALEALEETLKTLDDANAIPGGPIADTIWYSPYETLFDYLEVRIAAIKQARALDKKAENARELGLDYEPVREDWGPGPHEVHSLPPAAPVQDNDAHYKGVVEGVQKLFDDKRAQPAPAQPVGEVNRYGLDSHGRKWHGIHWYDPNVDVAHGTKLYTTPPAAQRQWVGLTDAEVMQTMSGDWTSQFYFARAIEAKLREKNT